MLHDTLLRFYFIFSLLFYGASSRAAELLPDGDFKNRWLGLCDYHYDAGPFVTLHNHAVQPFFETLSRDIEYEYQLEYLNTKTVFGPVDLEVYLLPSQSQIKSVSSDYFINTDSGSHGTIRNEFTPIGTHSDPMTQNGYGSDQWQIARKKFTARGFEEMFALEGVQDSTISVNNASVQCEPKAEFKIQPQIIRTSSGIDWKYFTKNNFGAGRAIPTEIWNSVRSQWTLIEVDSQGKDIQQGGIRLSTTQKDNPTAGMSGFFSFSNFNIAGISKLRYFRLVHESSCTHYGAYEAIDDDFLIINFEPVIDIDVAPLVCSEKNKNIQILAQVTTDLNDLERTVQITLHGPLGLIDSKTESISKNMSFTYSNPQVAGDYVFTLTTFMVGEPTPYVFVKKFKIASPSIKVTGLSLSTVAEKILFQTNAGPQVQTQWSYQDEQLNWTPPTLPAFSADTIELIWGLPNQYDVKAKGIWAPYCVAEDITMIRILDIDPKIKLTPNFNADLPCLFSDELEVSYHFDSPRFPIKKGSIKWYRNGSLSATHPIAGNFPSGKDYFSHDHWPGKYQAKVELTFEIKPGFDRTISQTHDFTVSPLNDQSIEVFVERPFYRIYTTASFTWGLKSVGTVGTVGTPAKIPTPDRIWKYEDENNILRDGPTQVDHWSHAWKARGVFPVQLEAKWNSQCFASATAGAKWVELPNIIVANAFTPNGSSPNETFYPVSKDLKDVTFKVMNSWGEILYIEKKATIEEMNVGWDGTYRGEPVALGTYAYWVEGTDYVTGEKVYKSGTVMVIR